MPSVQQSIIALNTNFQKLNFENNSKFFSDILPEKIDEISCFINQLHDKYQLPYGIENFNRKTNLEREFITEFIIRTDLNDLQKDYLLNICKRKIEDCLLQFQNDCYYPGILTSLI